MLVVAAGLVLLIGCANIASLLPARTSSRHKELATQLAVGAGRGRLARQFLSESVVLVVLGSTAGILLASLGSHLLATVLISGMSEPVLLDRQAAVRIHPIVRRTLVMTSGRMRRASWRARLHLDRW